MTAICSHGLIHCWVEPWLTVWTRGKGRTCCGLERRDVLVGNTPDAADAALTCLECIAALPAVKPWAEP
jgi:hypothetical protein